MELASWKVWPDGDTQTEKARLEREHGRLFQRANRARLKAVENIYYVLIRHDGASAVSAMSDIAQDHKETQLGQQAMDLLTKTVNSGSTGIYRYHGLWEAASKQLARLAPAHQFGAVAATTGAKAPVVLDHKAPQPPVADNIEAPEEHNGGEATSGPLPLSRAAIAVVSIAALVAVALYLFCRRSATPRHTT